MILLLFQIVGEFAGDDLEAAARVAKEAGFALEKPPEGLTPLPNDRGVVPFDEDARYLARVDVRGWSVERLIDLYYLSVGRGAVLQIVFDLGDAERLRLFGRAIRFQEATGRFDRVLVEGGRWTLDVDGKVTKGVGRRLLRIEGREAKCDAPIKLYRAPRMARAPEVKRGGETVTVVTGGLKVRYTTDGTEPTPKSPVYVTPFTGRYIVVAAFADDNPDVVFLEPRIVVRAGLARAGLKVVSFDSEERSGEDGRAANAVDGDPDTFWHTEWAAKSPPHPHEIVLDLGEELDIARFGYLPRQDGGVNGTIDEFELLVSADGKSWRRAAAGRLGGEKVVDVGARGRYLKLVAKSEVNGNPWTSAAELSVFPK